MKQKTVDIFVSAFVSVIAMAIAYNMIGFEFAVMFGLILNYSKK